MVDSRLRRLCNVSGIKAGLGELRKIVKGICKTKPAETAAEMLGKCSPLGLNTG